MPNDLKRSQIAWHLLAVALLWQAAKVAFVMPQGWLTVGFGATSIVLCVVALVLFVTLLVNRSKKRPPGLASVAILLLVPVFLVRLLRALDPNPVPTDWRPVISGASIILFVASIVALMASTVVLVQSWQKAG